MTPADYQTLLLGELDKLLSNPLVRMNLTADQLRQVKAARAAIARPDEAVAGYMLNEYNLQQSTEDASQTDTKLIGLLSRKLWLYSERFKAATVAQKAAHDAQQVSGDAKTPSPYSEEQMVQMELDMLEAQIELER